MHEAKYTFEAIGTQWSIETPDELPAELKEAIDKCISNFSHTYSRFDPTSTVSAMRLRGAGSYTYPGSIKPLFATYEKLHETSQGAVNPLIGTSLEQLGYDADYSLESGEPQPAPDFSSIELTGSTLKTTSPVLLDIGAIGKGYLIDTLGNLLSQHFQSYVIDGSGDILIHTEKPQTIGLENPRDPSRIIGTISIQNKSLCASATNRRSWCEFHHILDARTGEPQNTDIIATWAVADDTMTADALTTALFFTKPESLTASFGDFHYVILNKDGSVRHNISTIGTLYT